MKTILLSLVLLLVPAAGAPVAAQTVVVDQGAFRLSVAGREVGRDSFDIRRSGSGEDARIFAQGWSELDGRSLTSILETDGAHVLAAYQVTVGGAESAEIRARVSGSRLEMTVLSAAGERTRELRARDGLVLLEEGLPHQHYFLGALAAAGSSLPVVVPRTNTQTEVQVQGMVSDPVTVGGQRLEARRLDLSVGGVERRVWIDGEGRVLRVETPSTGFVAERLRPPA